MRLELTRRGDYAVRAMLALSGAVDGRPVSVRRIAESMSIPPQILPSVMRELVRAGLAEAIAGRSGGYRLARPPAAINLLQIVEAIEGDTRRQTCVLRGGPCAKDGTCAVHGAFFAAQEGVRSHLAAATLASVMPPPLGR
jgi:Rrf2 family iron-sulfur cluster assembly transcriptional regulator